MLVGRRPRVSVPEAQEVRGGLAAGVANTSLLVVANMLATAGVSRVLTIDLHAPAIEGFFDIPVDHLRAAPILAQYARKMGRSPRVNRVHKLLRTSTIHRKAGNMWTDCVRRGSVFNEPFFASGLQFFGDKRAGGQHKDCRCCGNTSAQRSRNHM